MKDITELRLNDEQRKAIEYGSGPLLIIAGAGTGKTTVITERIKYLISSGKAKPQEILALTFTEKASREMEERVDLALPYGVTQMWISTFHAFCDRILRNEAMSVGLDPTYKLMTEAETIQFFKNHLFEFNLSYFRPLGNPTKFIRGMIQHFSRLKDEDVNTQQYEDWVKDKKSAIKDHKSEAYEDIEKYAELAGSYKKYEELKAKEGMCDYGDLIANVLKIFRMRKAVLKTYQEQFTYILIDEFQDTNISQNELVILLSGKKQNLTVVADDDQAIYRWRGAAVSNILQFRKKFPRTKVVVLTKNYRSTKEILDRSYDLIQNNNPDRLEVMEKIDKRLECVRRVNGKPISLIYENRVENEAENVAKTIKDLESTQEPYHWKDFAILVRANVHADPFVRALARNGIPYQFLGPGQLLKQPEVKDLIAYLKVLYDVGDNIALYRVLTMDHIGIAPRDVAAIVSHAKHFGISFFESCESLLTQGPALTDDGKTKTINLVQMIYKHLGLIKKETAGQILYYFLSDTGLIKTLISYATEKEERIAKNVAKFFDKLKTYEMDHTDASIFAVADWLDLSMDLGESPLATDSDWNSIDAVNILTLHSAKGLEFPVVFLVNLVNARFPTTEKHEQIPIPDELVKEVLPVGDYHMEEERRLFYVGMTRAKDLLYLAGAKYYGEGKREKKISPFVEESVGKTLIDKALEGEKKQIHQLSFLDWEKGEEQEKKPIVRPVSYLSYSQIDTYKNCPLQYKYRHVIKIPVPPKAALSFGDVMHRTVKLFSEELKKGLKPTKDIFFEMYEQSWSALGYKNKTYEKTMRDHGKELLSAFYDDISSKDIHILSLETPFKIKITKDLILGGKIDRVDDLGNGRIEIIDYKTGNSPKKRDAGKDMQLSVYALAATDKGTYGKKPEQVVVSLLFFEGLEKMSAERTGEQLDATKKDIERIAHDISASSFEPTPGNHCDFCEFRLICEAWK